MSETTGEVPGAVARPAGARAFPWTLAACLASVAYALVVLVLPARDLTFLWDDWPLLARLHDDPWPRRWLAPLHDHWKPAYIALFDLEHALFGARPALYLVASWAIHAANVFLLARWLRARTGDERAAALGTAAFGLTTIYYEVLQWPELGGFATCLTCVLLALLALESASVRGARVAALSALVFVAPMWYGLGLALGPTVALASWRMLPRERRTPALLAVAASWFAYLVLYRIAGSQPDTAAPLSLEALRSTLVFLVHEVGLGTVARGLGLPADGTTAEAAGLLAIYAALVFLLARRAGARDRTTLLVAHAFAALVLGLIAVGRWHNRPLYAAVESRYQYLVALAWSAAIATALARRSRRSLAVTALAVAVAGGLQAHRVFVEERPSCITWRRTQGEFVAHLTLAARRAKGPIFDAPAPVGFAGFTTRQLYELGTVAPAVSWTQVTTRETIAPYLDDEVLRLYYPAR